jgi:hypothetical protein
MAVDFESVDIPLFESPSSPNLEISYFAIVYRDSLNPSRIYLESLKEHINLLYGPSVDIRLGNLSLHDNDLHLSGLLVQLALDEKVAMITGSDCLRSWNVDLLSLISCSDCTHEYLASKWIGDFSAGLKTCTISIESMYV